MTLHSHDEWERIATHLAKQDHVYLVVHETDGPPDQTIEEIDAYHKSLGWLGIGYHRAVYRDGTIHECRPDDVMGAQAQDLNSKSIGMAFIGTFAKDLPPDAQWKGGVHCAAVLCLRWNIPVKNIIGHRDVSHLVGDPSVATDCPGDPIYRNLPTFRAEVVQEMDRIQKEG